MKSKFTLGALFLSLAFFLTGCVTAYQYKPVVGSNDAAMANSNLKFEVLGMVSKQVDGVLEKGQKTIPAKGIKTMLLEEAKKMYPDANMVVDITITAASTVTSIPVGEMVQNISKPATTYIAEGTVIKLMKMME